MTPQTNPGSEGADPAPEAGPRRDAGAWFYDATRILWDWARSLALALILFMAFRTFVLEPFTIPTASMEGTILVGDFLLVNKAVYGAEIPGTPVRLPALHEPVLGEVVVFTPPHDPEKNYVKRLVGVGGDVLEMREKVLYRNGEPLEEPYVQHLDGRGDAFHPRMRWQRGYLADGADGGGYRPSRDNWGPILVPPGRLFVLGDNRDNSEDSRYWGFVTRESLRGRPWRVYYSSDTTGGSGFDWLREVRWDRIWGKVE
jgi:signal peptidase I